MKKIPYSLILLFLLIGSSRVFAQAFTFERISPSIVDTTIGDMAQQIFSYGMVNNLTGSPLTYQIHIVNRYVTPGWDSIGMCTWRQCYVSGYYDISEQGSTGRDTLHVYFSPYMHPGNGHCTVTITASGTTVSQDFYASADPIGIHQISTVVKDFSLGQNFPNPFNPSTKINFTLPKAEYTFLRVYDILGREVKTLIAGQLNAGEYQVDFDAKDFASGMYYYSLRAGENVTVKKMVLVK